LQWTIAGPGVYQTCGRTIPRLPAGAYTCSVDMAGNAVFQVRNLQLDELIDFPDSLPAKILEEIERFWGMGDRFAKYGFLHRRGYLFYGKQGSGKSSLIHQIIDRVVRADYVAFFCHHPATFVRGVEVFRQAEPGRPIVCIFEDIDAIIGHYGDSELLQWLDGNDQVNKAVNLASTNYPEKLDRRIVSRPRRFDRILRIDPPDDRLRSAYLTRKLPDQPAEERRRWVELTQGLTFAALAELVISVCCLENDLEETVRLLKELDALTPSSNEFGTNVPPSPRRGDDLNDFDIPF
ncbi:MAG: AAA family ATPase, partial [Pirellulaceae bacterium]